MSRGAKNVISDISDRSQAYLFTQRKETHRDAYYSAILERTYSIFFPKFVLLVYSERRTVFLPRPAKDAILFNVGEKKEKVVSSIS